MPNSRRSLAALALFGPMSLVSTCLGQNHSPATPTVTEPVFDGRVVNAGDVHMETTAFSDQDAGDTHVCTDWEIWSITPVERVWSTLCIGSVERIHTHLGDGVFAGSLAGRRELFTSTNYRLRVRHRDSSGAAATEWSGWGERLFTTGPASQVFPLEVQDIAPSPIPTWTDTGGAAVRLPAGTGRVTIGSEEGLVLTEFTWGSSANQINNPPSLAEHAHVLVVVDAGSAPLALPESDVTFTDEDGAARTIYLPAVNLVPGAQARYWVSTNGSTYVAQVGQAEPDFTTLARGTAVPWSLPQPGFKAEIVATGFQLPVNIAFIPNPGATPTSPVYYVTELYGTIKVVYRDKTVHDYATGLLNFNPTGNFPGSGEQGVSGICVDPATGNVYASMLYSSVPGQEAVPHYPKIVRFTSNDGGRTAATQTTILNMTGEAQGQSHQISNLTIGPDGKLYQHMGDGFDTATAQNLGSYRGKILRLNLDGTAPSDNPFYNAGDGITARDYVYAYGVRNPFGGAWREVDGSHYIVENGPSVDRFSRLVRGRNYGWVGSDASMATFALYNWNPSCGPVNIAFPQAGTMGGSGFPADRLGHGFITESGPTWGDGPQSNGKRITEWVFDGAGALVTARRDFAVYNGSGKASAVAIAAGPDGLYFSDFYRDRDYVSPIDRGSNILRIRYVGAADFSADVTSGLHPLTVAFTDHSTVPGATAWSWSFGDGGTSSSQNPVHVYTSDGVYTVRLVVTGSGGPVVVQKSSLIRVGQVKKVAIIGASLPPTATDVLVGDFVRSLGYDVTPLDDEPANRPTAAAIAATNDLVIVSSTITSANVGAEFRNVGLPMIFWESAMLRTDREALSSSGVVVGGSTQIQVLAGSHPITRGVAAGTVTVFNPAANMSVATGTRGPGVQTLALRSGSSDGAILAADAGASLLNGAVAPARRVYMFLEDSSFTQATPTARQLFANAVRWAIGEPLCAADFDGDGALDFFDYDAFVTCFEGGACPPGRTADFDNDGAADFFDYDTYVQAFEAGC